MQVRLQVKSAKSSKVSMIDDNDGDDYDDGNDGTNTLHFLVGISNFKLKRCQRFVTQPTSRTKGCILMLASPVLSSPFHTIIVSILNTIVHLRTHFVPIQCNRLYTL
jgi:hypothetical protein